VPAYLTAVVADDASPLSPARAELAPATHALAAASHELAAAQLPLARIERIVHETEQAERDLEAARAEDATVLGLWISAACDGERPQPSTDLVARIGR
jgi:hypothetical protein